jgi:hypothetical protein
MGLHEQAVVDPFLRFMELRLRVVDAMIAERAADLIREHVPKTSTLLHLFALADWHLTQAVMITKERRQRCCKSSRVRSPIKTPSSPVNAPRGL